MNKTLLIISAALLMAGCSKKSTPAPVVDVKVQIVGKWNSTSDVEVITKDGAAWHTYDIPGFIYLQFNSNGTGTRMWDDGPRTFKYTISDKNITLVYDRIDFPDGSYGPSFTDNLAIKSISSSALVVIHEDDVTQDGSLYHTVETEQFSK